MFLSICMLFANISGDEVKIYYKSKNISLPNKDIERVLPVKLKELTNNDLPEKILLLNGPGSFTAIRIGTLSFNLWNYINKNQIQLYNITKLDLFTYLHKQNIIPNQWIIYIWQKKNFWEYDCKIQNHKIINDFKLLPDKYRVDDVHTDLLPNLESSKFIRIWMQDAQTLFISYQWKKHKLHRQELDLKPQTQVKPEYLISPNIQKN